MIDNITDQHDSDARPGDLLLEREREIARFGEIVGTLADSGGRIVFVTGEPGAGKSALVSRFLQGLPPGLTKATGYCDPVDTPYPLGPVRELVQTLGVTHSDARGEPAFGPLVAHLQNAGRPAIFLIEDLHWADHLTLDWISFIGRRISQVPMCLILTAREGPRLDGLRAVLGSVPARVIERFELPPLSVEALGELARGSRYLAGALAEITGGNPFFATALIRESHESGADPRDVPRSVSDLVASQFRRLTADAREMLSLLSASPFAVPYPFLKALAGEGLYQAADAAILEGLAVDRGSKLGFRHELVRRAVYRQMTAPGRRKAHERFLRALLAREGDNREDPPGLEVILHHADRAGAAQQVRKLALAAAEAAAKIGGHREAAQHLATALRHLGSAPVDAQANLHQRFAYEAGLSLAFDQEAIHSSRKAAELWQSLGRSHDAGEALSWLSRLLWYRGEAAAARDALDEAISLLENAPEGEARARAFALRAQFEMLQDKMDAARDWAAKALSEARASGALEIQAHALNTLGTAALFRGDPGGKRDLRESLALSLEHGFHEQAARVYTNLSECLIEMRALDEAGALIDEGITFDSTHDLDSWTWYLAGRKAHQKFEMGRYDEAEAIARSVLAREGQTLLMQMPARIVLARARLRTGRRDAGDLIARAIADAGRVGEPQYLAALHIARLEQAVLTGREDAHAALDWLMAHGPAGLSPRKLGEAMFWARVLGLAEMPRGDTLPDSFGLFLTGNYKAAAAAFEREHALYFAAWSRALSGQRNEIARADHSFEAQGATAARRILRQPKYRCGTDLPALPRGRYRSARAHPYGLTARQQKVLSLLVEGHSNAEIARLLGRSIRTVEGHVAAILQSLNCRNRVEVLLAVQSRPWILQ